MILQVRCKSRCGAAVVVGADIEVRRGVVTVTFLLVGNGHTTRAVSQRARQLADVVIGIVDITAVGACRVGPLIARVVKIGMGIENDVQVVLQICPV